MYYPWTSFHRAEAHALPHSSSLHNWKHLGMKIESRWHINGRILQGHADKKRLLLLTGRFHDGVAGPPEKRAEETACCLTYEKLWLISEVERYLVQFNPSRSPPQHPQKKPFLLPSLVPLYVHGERQRVSAAQHKETCVKLYLSAASMNGNPSLWTLITQLLRLVYQCF